MRYLPNPRGRGAGARLRPRAVDAYRFLVGHQEEERVGVEGAHGQLGGQVDERPVCQRRCQRCQLRVAGTVKRVLRGGGQLVSSAVCRNRVGSLENVMDVDKFLGYVADG